MSSRKLKYSSRIAAILIISGIYGYIIYKASFDYSELQFRDLKASILPAAAAVLFFMLSFFFRCIAWKLTFSNFGYPLTLRSVGRILALSDLGRYIPGKIATVGGVLYLAAKEGVPPRTSGTVMFINLVIPLLVASIIFALSLLFLDFRINLSPALWSIAGIVLLGSTVLLQPPLFNRLSSFLHRIVKRGQFKCTVSYSFLNQNASIVIISWILQGLAFFLIAQAFFEIPNPSLPYFIGGNAIAFMIGLISIFAPAGIGVKEGILYVVLIQTLPSSEVAILVLIWRIFTTVLELMLAGISFAAFQFCRISTAKET